MNKKNNNKSKRRKFYYCSKEEVIKIYKERLKKYKNNSNIKINFKSDIEEYKKQNKIIKKILKGK